MCSRANDTYKDLPTQLQHALFFSVLGLDQLSITIAAMQNDKKLMSRVTSKICLHFLPSSPHHLISTTSFHHYIIMYKQYASINKKLFYKNVLFCLYSSRKTTTARLLVDRHWLVLPPLSAIMPSCCQRSAVATLVEPSTYLGPGNELCPGTCDVTLVAGSPGLYDRILYCKEKGDKDLAD